MSQKLRNPAEKESLYIPVETDGGGLSLDKSEFYLESLRKALLGKGKQLNKISLQSNNLPLLQKFLYQCGFSEEDTNNLLKELLLNNPNGEINFSQFFNKITEFSPAKKKLDQSTTLEPSAIPYIESILRDLGLTPKQVEYAVTSARVGGGGLDLNEFVMNVKGISNKEMSSQNKDTLDQFVTAIEKMISRSAECEDLTPENQVKSVHNLADQISKKLEGMGIQISAKEKGEEQIATSAAKQSQLPNDVKATVDQILEKVVIASEKDDSSSPSFYLSKLGSVDLHSKEKLSKKVLSSSKKTESSFLSKEAKLFSDLDTGKAQQTRSSLISGQLNDGGLRFNKEIIEEGNVFKSESSMGDISQNISNSTFSESINTGKQNAEHVRDFLPSYLIDQVGKQISRSILRGEKVIRLQLKPPELGSLRVEMDLKDNILKLGMITETNSAKELLLLNVHELKDALVQQGVKLDRLDVQINQDFDQSLANSKEGQDQDHNLMQFMTERGTEETILGSWNMTGGNRLLDLVA